MKENIYENCPLCKTKYEKSLDPSFSASGEEIMCYNCNNTIIIANAHSAIAYIICVVDNWMIGFNFAKNKVEISRAFHANDVELRKSLDFEISLYEEFYNDYKPILEKMIKFFELN